MPTFNVHLNAGGVVRCKAVVPAVEAGLVGDYYQGKPYQPDAQEVRDRLPYRYRKAFDRALKWWQDNSMSGRMLPLKCDLKTLKGEPMGTLFATPNWTVGEAGEQAVLTRVEFWKLHDACETAEQRAELHHRYYIQFATAGTREVVKRRIGEQRIKTATDYHFNDIPLKEWDALDGAVKGTISIKRKKDAEPLTNPNVFMWSLSDAVCIAKAVAREIRGW